METGLLQRVSGRVSGLWRGRGSGLVTLAGRLPFSPFTTGSNRVLTSPYVELAPGAEENGFAMMLADLVRQNLEAKPHKMTDFDALEGHVSIVADDADVALTMVFGRSGPEGTAGLTIHDGIVGIPALTIRGPSEAILALSNMPLATPLGLPLPSPGDLSGQKTVRELTRAMREGKLRFHGMLFHIPLVLKLTRVMSVNG
jgi:hypothetical protein